MVMFCGFVSRAQVKEEVEDTINKGVSLGKLQIKNPQSILSAYTYDP